MPEWTMSEASTIDGAGYSAVDEAQALLHTNELLQERLADVTRILDRDDLGWSPFSHTSEMSERERRRTAAHARFMAAANPMCKRGLGIRIGYVWGQGVEVSVDDSGQKGAQDVNGVIDTFWNDPSNRKTFTESQAQEANERQLGTDGEAFFALPTDPITGRVQVRSLPTDEITRIITNPEDKAEVWFYLREFTKIDTLQGTTAPMKLLYPSINYRPTARPKSITLGEEIVPVQWDAPVRAVQVNVPTGHDRGLGDLFAALPWARADREFLEDWAKLMKALAKIAWRVTTRGDKAQQAARKISASTAQPRVPGIPIPNQPTDSGAGATVGMDPNTTLEAVPKTGAEIDAESGKPLKVMIAAALGVPITMLLGDPGSTGARAVAQTLDQPTEHEMGLRRAVWTSVIRDICDYVIDQAVIAPAGPLRGRIVRTGNSVAVELGAADSRTVNVDWPPWDSAPIGILVKAITDADQTDKLPPLITFKLLATALGVDDIDEWVDKLTDENGNWIPLDLIDEQVRGQLTDRGQTGGAGTGAGAGGTDPLNPGADQPPAGNQPPAPDSKTG